MIGPRRNVFVAQPEVHRQVGTRLPGVGDVVHLAGRAKLGVGEARGFVDLVDITQHIVGESIVGGLVLETGAAARKLVALLAVAVAADVGAEFDGMGGARPGNVVGPLEAVVVVDVGRVGVVAKAAETEDADRGRAPGDRGWVGERNSQLGDRIGNVG